MKKAEFRHICKECAYSKDHMGGGCYCIHYGIIIGYPKPFCAGFERRENNEQVWEQKDAIQRDNV